MFFIKIILFGVLFLFIKCLMLCVLLLSEMIFSGFVIGILGLWWLWGLVDGVFGVIVVGVEEEGVMLGVV